MAKQEWIIEQDEPKGLVAGIGSNLLQGLANIGGIPATLQQLAGGPQQATGFAGQELLPFLPKAEKFAPAQELGGQLRKAAGLPEELPAPENIAEQYLFRLAQHAPGAALGGIQGLLGSALGSGVATGLEQVGVPEELADLAQLGTELGYGFYKGKIPSIKQTKKLEDQLMRAAVHPGTEESIGELGTAFNKVEKALETEVDQTMAGKIKDALGTIYKNITRKKINPTTAVDLRKKLYQLGNKLPESKAAEYIQPLTQGLNDFFSVYGAKNPYFYNHLTERDQLTTLANMNLLTTNLIKKIPFVGESLEPFVRSMMLGEPERFIRGIAGNSAARNYYFKTFLAGIENNPTLFAKNFNKLAEFFPKEEEAEGWIIE